MSTTKVIFMPDETGQTGHTLVIKNEDGTALNGSGDTLTESPANSGRFVATVTETISAAVFAFVKDSAGAAIYSGWLSPASDLIGDYPQASGSQGVGQYSITITVRDSATTNPIAGALVSITLGGALVRWGITATNGQVTFALDAGSYAINTSASGWTNIVGQSLAVSGVTTATVNMAAQTIAQPPIGQYASIAIKAMRGAIAVPNAIVKCELEDPASTVTAGAQMRTVFTLTTDQFGSGILVLPWTSSFQFGDGIYTVTILDPADGQVFHTRRVTVPDLSTANYYELPSPI